MKVRDITSVIEAYAPLSLQEDFDNSGLNVGNPESEVSGILLCVDVTEAVLDEAIALGANLIVSHHPLLFHPLRRVIGADASQRIVARCLISGISLYAAHTNLDNAPGGMNAVNLQVAEKYVEAFGQLAKQGNTLVVPANLGDITSLVTSAMTIVKGTQSSQKSAVPRAPSQSAS